MVWGQVEMLFVWGSGMFTIYGLGMGVWSYALSALTALNLAANHNWNHSGPRHVKDRR